MVITREELEIKNKLYREELLKKAKEDTERVGAHPDIQNFREGSGRDNLPNNSHTYAEVDGELYPMCGYGWNRSDGDGFSIFRGSYGTEGSCKLCRKNLRAGKLPVMNGFPHKTRYI